MQGPFIVTVHQKDLVASWFARYLRSIAASKLHFRLKQFAKSFELALLCLKASRSVVFPPLFARIHRE